MADFMDFNAWRDLASASEQEVLDRQMADVETRTREANQALSRAQRDAQMQRLKETQGAGVASTTLSSVGSYGDYLKARQAQQNAAAALRGGRVGELGDVRMSVSGDYLKRAGDLSQQLGSRERRVGVDDASGLAGANRLADERRAREAASAEAASNREDDFRQAREGHLAGLYQRWLNRDQHAASDNTLYARQLSHAVDSGWKLPERTAGARDTNPTDRRGWGIEADAWGTRSPQYGRARTKKGTAY